MAQDYSQVNFRIPTKLKEQIESAALKNNRSITAELVSRLEKSLANEELPTITQADKDYLTKIQAIEEKLDMIINRTDSVLKRKNQEK